jgi:RHS repeat-associated protein
MTRLVSKKTDGVITRFYWDGDALLGDVTDDDTREWIYYPGSFVPLVMIRNEEFYLYHNDPNGCPTRLLDESGKVVWAARYDAWGKVKKLLVDEVEQPLRLQGQYFDRETGLYYNRFRYYEPQVGSFISQDPLGLAAGENVYGFGPNAQVWIDPLGLCKEGGFKAGRYAPDRELPRTKHGDPIPDTDVPHTQLGKRDDGYGPYNQARTWEQNTNGKGITATEDIDFSDHRSPDIHPNPHKHKLTPNNPKTAPKGGYKRGSPELFKY